MKRWTKKDIKLLCSQLGNFVLFNRMYYSKEAIAADIARRRRSIVEGGLRGFKSMFEERSAENLKAAKHFEEHPNVYGSSTPEMIERFTKLGREDAKAAASIQVLLNRVYEEGLPPEVEAFDPMGFAVTSPAPIHFFEMPDDDELLRRANARSHDQMRAALELVIERLTRDVALARLSGNAEQEERAEAEFHRAQRALARLDRIRRR